jgi:ADP-heptose:LPS heptosyltransferase
MLSMDSGNAHIAAMLGVKVISLWGATHPYAGFVPFNQPLENSLVPDRTIYPLLPTSVYGNKEVEGYQDVMRTIIPTMVVELIKSNL